MAPQKKKITKANEKVTLERLSSKNQIHVVIHILYTFYHTLLFMSKFFIISKAHWIPQRFFKSNEGEIKSDLFNFVFCTALLWD